MILRRLMTKLSFRHKHWENPFHIIYANISPAIKPICCCLGRSVKLGNMHCGIGCISWMIISHIDPKSKCSEFAQCIELPLIAVFPHRLMRLLQPAVVLVLLVEEIKGLVCCRHCCCCVAMCFVFTRDCKEGTHMLVSSQIGLIA